MVEQLQDGIAGINYDTIKNCYNTSGVGRNSSVYGLADSAGGISGFCYGTIENCYNVGELEGSCVGGIVGKSSNANIINCYYLDNVLRPVGDVDGQNGKMTSEQMKDLSFVAQLNNNINQDENLKRWIQRNPDYPDYPEFQGYSSLILVGIQVTTPPNKVIYEAGEDFDKTGMVVVAIYNDGSTKELEEYTLYDATELPFRRTNVRISYKEGTITKTTTQDITVIGNELTGISVTKEPNKTRYKILEDFNPEGMVITATYSDGSTKEVTNYEVIDGEHLTTEKTSVTIRYTEYGISQRTTQPITVTSTLVELTEIAITTAPNKVSYNEGENFDPTGMVVTATYSDGSTAAVTGYTVTDGENLTSGKRSVTISYKDNGITKTTTQAITVTNIPTEKELSGIAITTAPNKVNYNEGENFDKTGMVVTATYSDGSTAAVTGYTVTDGENLTAGKTSVTISYTENGVTKTATQTITVKAKELTGIAITTAPNKVNYNEGENFDKTGMVVTATYSDGSTAAVTGYTVTDGENLTAGKTSVTISYVEGGVTKTTTQAITVKSKELTGISVTKAPNKANYKVGENFDKTGMVVTATYSDGSTATVTGYTVTDGENLTAGKTSVTISYIEGGITKTTTQTITVTAISTEKELTGISITTKPNKVNYKVGENFDKTGMVITATYIDGKTKEVTSYTVIDGKNLTAGKTSVTISYTENGVTKTATQNITVSVISTEKELIGISVTKAPNKANYKEGENFDKTGMVITATYIDGKTKEVTSYTVIDGENLTLGKTSVTISYTENGITKTTEQEIVVDKKAEEESDNQGENENNSNKNEDTPTKNEDISQEDSTIKEENKDKSTTNEKLPRTGISNYMLTIGMLSMIVIAIVSYIKYKKNRYL